MNDGSYNFSRSLSRENCKEIRMSSSIERDNEKVYANKKIRSRMSKDNKQTRKVNDLKNNSIASKPHKSKVSFNNDDVYYEISPKKHYGGIKNKVNDISESLSELRFSKSRNKSISYRDYENDPHQQNLKKNVSNQDNENKYKRHREEYKKQQKRTIELDNDIKTKDRRRTYQEESISSLEVEEKKFVSNKKNKRKQNLKESKYYEDRSSNQQQFYNNEYQNPMNNQNMNFQQFNMNQQQGFMNASTQQFQMNPPQSQVFGYNMMGASANMQAMGMMNNAPMINMGMMNGAPMVNMGMNSMGVRQMGYNNYMYNQPMQPQQGMFPPPVNHVGFIPPCQAPLPSNNGYMNPQEQNETHS